MVHWGWVLILVFIAAALGFFTAALCAAAKQGDMHLGIEEKQNE